MHDRLEKLKTYLAREGCKTIQRPVGMLENPFISPGSIYNEEIWDGGTLWSIKGPVALSEEKGCGDLREAVTSCGVGSLINFLKFQGKMGRSRL